MGKPKTATAAAELDTSRYDDGAARKKSETIKDYVLFRRQGDDRVPVMSDNDQDVVRYAKIQQTHDALATGRARPELFIVERTLTYPLGAAGARLAEGSTCEERELS